MNSKGTMMHWSDVVKKHWNAENSYKNYEEVKGIFVNCNCQKYFPDLLTYFISKKDTTDDYIAKAIDVYEKVYSNKTLSSSDESIQMLGNLTLLQKTPSAPSGKQNANSIASNKEPWVKFAAVYKSGLYITTNLTDTKKFEEDEIKARSAEFAEKFIDWLTF